MNYFKKVDNKIEKYSVELDIEELKNLRKEIIDNCSNIVHKDYEDMLNFPTIGKYHEIRNDSMEMTNKTKSRFGFDLTIWHYTYDEYIYPVLVIFIDRLLDGEVEAIDNIFSDDNNYLDVDQFDQLSKKLDVIDNLDIENKRKKLDELEKIIKKTSLHTNYDLIDEYYKKTQDLINLTYIDTIYIEKVEEVIEEVEKIETFFDNDIEKNYQKIKIKPQK